MTVQTHPLLSGLSEDHIELLLLAAVTRLEMPRAIDEIRPFAMLLARKLVVLHEVSFGDGRDYTLGYIIEITDAGKQAVAHWKEQFNAPATEHDPAELDVRTVTSGTCA